MLKSNSLFFGSVFTLVCATASTVLAYAPSKSNAPLANSSEVMCRNRAKEIAAQTYQSCVTDAKQTQIKSLRKEYEDKLAEVKSEYAKKLKNISSNGAVSSIEAGASGSNSSLEIKTDLKSHKGADKTSGKKEKYIKRSSGARELPDSGSGDYDSSSGGSDSNLESDLYNTQNKVERSLKNNTDASTVEIVEIQPEKE